MTATTSSGVENKAAEFWQPSSRFLFGDGNPNAGLEERRWQQIATVIRNNEGAVVAVLYLDDIGEDMPESTRTICCQ